MDDKLVKKAFIEAYGKTFGNITQSCTAVGICRQTFYNWQKSDNDFVNELNNIEPEELLLDFIDSKLVQKINEGDTTALIFVAKTKGKKRGYVERMEQEISGPGGGHIVLKLDDGCSAIKEDISNPSL